MTCAAVRWELRQVDWHEPPPAPWIGAFDVVSSHFFVESATPDEAEALTFVRNYAGLAAGDAVVLLSFLQRADAWDCDGVAVPSLQVHEGMIESFLRSRGNRALTTRRSRRRQAASRRRSPATKASSPSRAFARSPSDR